jgi:signal transduction histidine kinase
MAITWVLAAGAAPRTTYAFRSNLGLGLALAAAAALLLPGLLSPRVPRLRLGDLGLVLALAWLAPVVVAWPGGPDLLRSAAAVFAAAVLPLGVHLSMAGPDGRVASGIARALLLAAYLETAIATTVTALFRDPYLDPSCLANCTANRFLVHPYPRFVQVVSVLDAWAALGLAALSAVVVTGLLVRASTAARRRLLPVSIPAEIFVATTAGHRLVLLRLGADDPYRTSLFGLFVAESLALGAIGAGLLWLLARGRIERRAVERVVLELDAAPSPGSLARALAAALVDPGLLVAYWLPRAGRYVSADGRTVSEPALVPGRALTRVSRGPDTVAVISHAGAVPDLAAEIGPAMRLGLENERLQAEVLGHLADLRASRRRIVAAGDAERRGLERDLHDGAQQRLLALSYDCRLALAAARTDGDDDAAVTLAAAVQITDAALADLRALARGIFPAVLDEAGLGEALRGLAEASPLPLELGELDDGRCPRPVESAAYYAVVDAMRDASARGATHLAVGTRRRHDRLVVEIASDATPVYAPTVEVADRVGALAGAIVADGPSFLLEIPCE